MAVSHLTRPKRKVTSTGEVRTPSSHHPLVSVLMPCYNVESTLRRCLDSVVSQDYRPLEIICVNDGSKDTTIDILREYQQRFDADASIGRRFVVVDKENGGYGSAMNTALGEARGSYIAMAETDDWLEQSFYSTAIEERYKRGIDADIIKTPYNRVIRDDNGRTSLVACSYKGRIPQHVSLRLADTPELLLHHPSIWSALYKKSFLENNNIRFVEAPGAGWTDNPFLYETLLRAKSILYIDKAFYDYVEDTRNEERELYRKQPDVPSDRFGDDDAVMHKLAKEAGAVEETWMAHSKRGFNYMDYILHGSDQATYESDKAWMRIDKIVALIPPVLALENEELTSFQKTLYFERRRTMYGDDRTMPVFVRRHDKLRFYLYLIKQGLYRVSHTSISFTFKSMVAFLNKRKPNPRHAESSE